MHNMDHCPKPAQKENKKIKSDNYRERNREQSNIAIKIYKFRILGSLIVNSPTVDRPLVCNVYNSSDFGISYLTYHAESIN